MLTVGMAVYNTKSLPVYSIPKKMDSRERVAGGLVVYVAPFSLHTDSLCEVLTSVPVGWDGMDSIFAVSQDGGDQMLCSWAAVECMTVMVKWTERGRCRKG